jgi:ferredoxin/flavodoxin
MKFEIYYFSGTGNSLAVAKDIVEKTDSKLIAIKDVSDKDAITPNMEGVGIIFPAYYTQLPRIVERFISKLDAIENKYIFSIITVGGIAGDVVSKLQKAISDKNGKLSASFIVQMPANYIDESDALPPFLQQRMFKKWDKKINEIVECINSRKYDINKKFNPVMTFLFSGYIEKKQNSGLFSPDIDDHFWVDDKCNLCGICRDICPVNNIMIEDKAVIWNNNCEKCLACIQWCPKQAIQFDEDTVKRTRYHHPNVTVSEMVGNKKYS